jgi:hypothetical protein
MPYDNDGTVVYAGVGTSGAVTVVSSGDLVELNDYDFAALGSLVAPTCWYFFPEQREVTAFYYMGVYGAVSGISTVTGSNDSVNGLDGTWQTATLSGGAPTYGDAFSWRSGIKPISFTGAKRTVRLNNANTSQDVRLYITHLYGEKAAGQTPDDIIYINHDDTPGVEFTAPEDFGDQPLATSVTRQFRVKNTSALTANTINIQCNDSDFIISTDGSTWVVTINIASLAAGAESSTMYVRCTTPAVGSALGPRHARIVATVASYT